MGRRLCCEKQPARLRCRSRLLQQLRQLGDIAGNPSHLVFGEQLGRCAVTARCFPPPWSAEV